MMTEGENEERLEEVVADNNEGLSSVSESVHEEAGSSEKCDVDDGRFSEEFVNKEGCRNCCTCTRRQWLCFNMEKSELPKLQEGFWGTKALLNATNCLPKVRSQWGVPLLYLFSFIALGGMFGLTYLNLTFTPEGFDSTPLYLNCINTYWANNSRVETSCGVGAMNCRPFETDSWTLARCPKKCNLFWSEPVLGTEKYVATSRICASAIHAGVIPAGAGGCFEFRFSGEQSAFEGSERNGITSQSYGWFPRSLEYRAVANNNCNQVGPWVDVYVFVMVLILLLFVRADPWYCFQFLGIAGFLYLATFQFTNQNYSQILNSYSPRLLFILVASYFLWKMTGKRTFPDPRRFPIDALVFYFLPFWMGIHMEVLQDWGIDLSFSSDLFSSPGDIAGLTLFIVIGAPLVLFQLILLVKADKWRKLLLYVVLIVVIVIIVSLSTSDYLSLHLHHYMVGGLGFLIFQGQPRLRYSIIIQALLYGVFVNGVTVWNTAPLYNSISAGSSGSSGQLVWTGVNISGTSVALEWAPPSTVFNVWNCSTAGLQEYREMRKNGTIESLSSLDNTLLGMTTALQPFDSTSSEKSLLSTLDDVGRRALARILSAGYTSNVTSLVPPDGTPSYQVSANTILLLNSFFDADLTYSSVFDLVYPETPFQLAVAGTGGLVSLYLTLQVLVEPNRTLIGGGFYDGENPFFAEEPCNRVYSLLSDSQNITSSD